MDSIKCPKNGLLNSQKPLKQLGSLNHTQNSDHSLFVQEKGSTLTIVLIYVDDIIITGNNDSVIQDIKLFLQKQFHIKDLGKLKYFLGLEVARSKAGIVIS